MKKKDIVILAISFVVIFGAIFMMLRLLSPNQNGSQNKSEADSIPTVPDQIDETTYKTIESLFDYGEATLQNIGKTDLFAGF